MTMVACSISILFSILICCNNIWFIKSLVSPARVLGNVRHSMKVMFNPCAKNPQLSKRRRGDEYGVHKIKIWAAAGHNNGQPSSKQQQFIDEVNKDADQIMQSSTSSTAAPMVEEEGNLQEKSVAETNWTGQGTAEVIRESKRNWSDLFARSGLATVDVFALLAFAAVGRLSHNEHLNILLDLQTAAPFIASWCLLSPWIGAYTRESTASMGTIPSCLLPSWVVCMPTALVIRGISRGAIPPTPFIIVSMVSTFIALWLFRSLYVLAVGDTSDAEQRSAGPLEVFAMIGTLLKRW